MEKPGNSINRPIGYPSSSSSNLVTNASSLSYSRFGNEIGWDHGDFSPKGNQPYMIRWKSGKRVDQRLLMILESYFEDIYHKRRDFFKKIFPGQQKEFEKIFEKIEMMLENNENKMKQGKFQRSLSIGSPRFKLGKFKIKTPGVFLDVESPEDDNVVEYGTKY